MDVKCTHMIFFYLVWHSGSGRYWLSWCTWSQLQWEVEWRKFGSVHKVNLNNDGTHMGLTAAKCVVCIQASTSRAPASVDRRRFILSQTQAVVEKPQLCQSLHSACGLLKLGNRAPYIWRVEDISIHIDLISHPYHFHWPHFKSMSETERHITSFSSVSLNWSTNLLSICSEETQAIIKLLDRPKKWESKNAPGLEETVLHTIIAVACSAQPRSLDVGLETPLPHSCQ